MKFTITTLTQQEVEDRRPKCGNCRFWKLWNGTSDGLCRRRSPVMSRDANLPVHPRVCDDYWCGEWEAKPSAP